VQLGWLFTLKNSGKRSEWHVLVFQANRQRQLIGN